MGVCAKDISYTDSRAKHSLLRRFMPVAGRLGLGSCGKRLLIESLRRALHEQGLSDLYAGLGQIVPDIRHQYSTFTLDTEFLTLKTRALHAFQISLVQRALALLGIGASNEFKVADIGDSAGTHVQYVRGLYKNSRSLSVNADVQAVERVRSNGLEALHARAEDIASLDLNSELILSFETLEHLLSPISFLRALAGVKSCRALVVSVPYLTQSRVGLQYIRDADRTGGSPERVHVFELSPEDWRLIFQFAGWKVLHDQVYLQYPRRGLFRVTKPYWKAMDFEGFYGAILGQDDSWSTLYGWSEAAVD